MNKGVWAIVALAVVIGLVLVFRANDHAQVSGPPAEASRPRSVPPVPVDPGDPAPVPPASPTGPAPQRYGQLLPGQLPAGIRMDPWSSSPADGGLVANFRVANKRMEQIDVAALQQQLQPLLIERLCGLATLRREVLDRGSEVKAIVRDGEGVVLSEQTIIRADCGMGA